MPSSTTPGLYGIGCSKRISRLNKTRLTRALERLANDLELLGSVLDVWEAIMREKNTMRLDVGTCNSKESDVR